MKQIKHMIEDDSVLFYVEDEESVSILAVGDLSDFDTVEGNAAERYLDHLAEQEQRGL